MKTPFIRAVILVLIVAMLAASITMPVTAAENAATAKTDAVVGEVREGYYRIRNLATGKYLDTYDLIYDYQGTAYLDKATGQNGQDIYVSRNADGTYSFTPQSDNAKYALSYAAGAYVTKKNGISQTESFHILPLIEGSYAIAPAYAKSTAAVLTASNTPSRYGYARIDVTDYMGQPTQQWVLEPIAVTGISMAYTEVRERLYTVGTYYATVTPYPVSATPMVWSSDNENVLMIDEKGEWVAVGVGTATVTVTCGDAKTSCRVEVIDSPSYAFYSQHNIDGSYWNGSALSGISFSSGVTKRYAVDRYNNNADWMDEGCALTCHAIALRNLGATMTEGYDFRSGQNGNLPADPYTVSLANSGNKGATSPNATMYGNPILVNHRLIATRFTLNGKAMTCDLSYVPTAKQIKEALDKHPEGVVVGLYNYRYQNHYLLFTKCTNPEETNPNKYKFIVCDPAAYTPSEGDNVPFEQSYSYAKLGYRLSGATCMLTWDVVEPAAKP